MGDMKHGTVSNLGHSCALWRLNIVLCLATIGACSVPIVNKFRKKSGAKNTLASSVQTYRKLAFYTSLVSLVFSVTEGPKLFALPIAVVSTLHYFETYVDVQKIPSWELLIWWPLYATCLIGHLSLDMVDEPSFLGLFSVGSQRGMIIKTVLAISTCFFEANSGPRNATAYGETHIYGRIFCAYLNPLIEKAYQGERIHSSEIGDRPGGKMSVEGAEDLLHSIEKFSPTQKNRIAYVMIWNTIGTGILCVVLDAVKHCVKMVMPWTLGQFLSALHQIEDGSRSMVKKALLYATLSAIASLFENILTILRQRYGTFLITTWRSALLSLIFRKSMRISNGSRKKFDSPRLMNLVQTDVAKMQWAFPTLAILLVTPIQVVLSLISFRAYMGNAMYVALPIYALFIYGSTKFRVSDKTQVRRRRDVDDLRVKTTLNIFRNIKSLKLYAWEYPFAKKVIEYMRKYTDITLESMKIRTAVGSIDSHLDDVVLIAIILASLWKMDEPLTAERLFPLVKVSRLTTSALKRLPSKINLFLSSLDAQEGINELLAEPEESSENFHKEPSAPQSDWESPLIEVKDARVAWNSENTEKSSVALPDISMTLRRGDLCCVVGRVGVGKTALIDTLCGDMNIVSGSVTVRGSVALAAQENWLQYLSVRENILFGLDFDAEFYEKVIKACDLQRDIQTFPEGDSTLIGEKGISLSGGQRARLALARAVYSRADVYIFDDVLSAVDHHVTEVIISQLLAPGGLLSTSAIILATHSTRVLKSASQLLCLSEGGKVQYYGDIRQAKADDLVSACSYDLVGTSLVAEELLPSEKFDRRALIYENRKDWEACRLPTANLTNPIVSTDVDFFNQYESDGGNNISVFASIKSYLCEGDKTAIVTVFTLLVASALLTILSNFWLSYWSSKGLIDFSDSRSFLAIFSLIIVANGTLVGVRDFIFNASFTTQIYMKLHNRMLHSTLRAPMSFFEKTPIGTIMGRFMSDLSVLQGNFATNLKSGAIAVTTALLNTIVAVAGAPVMPVVLIVVLMKCRGYARRYSRVAQQLTPMAKASRNSSMSHLEETIRGIKTVTVFRKRDDFLKGMDVRSEDWLRLHFANTANNEWFSLRLNMIMSLLSSAADYSLIAGMYFLGMRVGFAVLVMASIDKVGEKIKSLTMLFSEFEQDARALQRIYESIECPKEAPYFSDVKQEVYLGDSVSEKYERKPKKWVSHGIIEFEDYSARFERSPSLALDKINLHIGEAQKIGVVGRTGAGKTTLAMSLFRVLEGCAGKITIDGVQISELGLFDLRSNLAVIPQEAQIFRASLRENLDPMGEYTDERLWSVLEICHLKDHFKKAQGLDTSLAENGDNVSYGQAQLICLGRALLHPSKILVLDEATASVDTYTDSLVQKTIREEFGDRTIITVAHRTDTIMDSDRILVLDKGVILEDDSPEALLNAKGAFYKLLNG